MVETIKCPLCSFTSKQEPRFYEHLSNAHDITNYEQLYIDNKLSGIKPTCECSSECLAPLKWFGWNKGYRSKFVRGHNAKVYSAFSNKEVIQKSVQKRKDKFLTGEYSVWNSGLTKNTDERILKASKKISSSLTEGYATGKIVDWRKNNVEKSVRQIEKMSKTKRKKFAAGESKPWNKGLSKETNESLLSVSKKNKEAYKKREAGRRLKPDEFLERIKNVKGFDLISSSDDYCTRRVNRLIFKCQKCGIEARKSLAMAEESPRCFTCNPKESVAQLEIYEFVKTLSKNAILSDRTTISPKEIDVLIPNVLAIEYDSLWFHNETKLHKKYASNKRELCAKEGLSYMCIFEDEWRDKRSIVESMIKHRLGIFDLKIGARQCKIKSLTSKERSIFFNSNHLDGDTKAKYAIGLFFNERLVSAISLRNPNHKIYKDDCLEVSRFALDAGVAVPGALSRLTSAAKKYANSCGKKKIISYVDLRYGNGNGYISSGYSLIKKTALRFWWTDFVKRYDRFKFRAQNGISEKQIAEDNCVVKIWGCSNLLFEYL